jgi:hypothetical protein
LKEDDEPGKQSCRPQRFSHAPSWKCEAAL